MFRLNVSKPPGRPIPGKLVVGIAQRGLEVAFEGATHDGVQTIGADDEVSLSYLCEESDKLAER